MTARRKRFSDKGDVPARPSGWYYADMTMAVVTVLWLWLSLTGFLYQAVSYIPLIALAAGIIVYSRKEYYADRLSKPWRMVTGVIRAALYAAALFSCSLTFVMSADMPVLYPLQKAVYMANYTEPESIFGFLPDNIPPDVQSYKVRFVPRFLQGDAYIRIEFFTDTGQLEIYREYARSSGAQKETAHESYAEYIGSIAGKEELPEVWKFPSAGRYSAYYYIYPESGYFIIQW